jgi:hypothetical protein
LTVCYLTLPKKARCLVVLVTALFEAEPQISAAGDPDPADLKAQISGIDDLVRGLLEAKARIILEGERKP